MPKRSRASANVKGQKTLMWCWQRVSAPDPGSGPSVPVVVDHDGPQPAPIVKRVVLKTVEVCTGPGAPGEEGGDFGDDPSTSFDAVLMEHADVIESGAQEGERALARVRAAACYKLAHRYGLGDGVDQDIDMAWSLLCEAAFAGDADAQLCLGKSLDDEGGDFIERDVELAGTMYGLAAEQGDVEAQWRLGVCYEHGHGSIEQDHDTAALWYARAANQGDTVALRRLEMLRERVAESGDANATGDDDDNDDDDDDDDDDDNDDDDDVDDDDGDH